jgi:hypothetical protein
VLGDLNICAQPLDHCDGHLESVREGFWEHPARKWARGFFGEGGRMVDIVRMFWPDRKAMCVFLIIITIWQTLIHITGIHVRPPPNTPPPSPPTFPTNPLPLLQAGTPEYQRANPTTARASTTSSSPQDSYPGSRPGT